MAAYKLKHREFVWADAILRGLNKMQATREAVSAKVKEVSLAKISDRFTHNAEIQRYIADKRAEIEQKRRKEADFDEVYISKGFKDIFERCMQRIPVMTFDREEGRLVQRIDEETGQGIWTFDSNGANKALENLGKHIGYFEADNNQKQPIIKVNIVKIDNHYDDEQTEFDNPTEEIDFEDNAD